MWYIHAVEYYSVLKRNNVICAATWMVLEDIILSTINQAEQAYLFYKPGSVRYLE